MTIFGHVSRTDLTFVIFWLSQNCHVSKRHQKVSKNGQKWPFFMSCQKYSFRFDDKKRKNDKIVLLVTFFTLKFTCVKSGLVKTVMCPKSVKKCQKVHFWWFWMIKKCHFWWFFSTLRKNRQDVLSRFLTP